jgi:hypothetical protein
MYAECAASAASYISRVRVAILAIAAADVLTLGSSTSLSGCVDVVPRDVNLTVYVPGGANGAVAAK